MRTKANIFLGLMVVSIALSNIEHILIDMDFLASTNIIRKLYLPLQWLITPMFYFHVNEVLYKKRPKKWITGALLAPFVLVTLTHTIHFLYLKNKISVSAMPDYYEDGLLLNINLLSFLFHGVILFSIFKMLKTNTVLTKNSSNKKYQFLKWYTTIIIFFVAIVFVGLFSTISLIQFNLDPNWLLYIIFLLVSFAAYYLGYIGVYRFASKEESKTPINTAYKNGTNTYQKVHSYIIEERRYLDMNLNQSEIAAKFKITPGYLSQLINTHGKQNFNDYINRLRIETSKNMLIEDEFENYTIESIGLECGFKSKSNFYAAFKKFTDLTPKAYIKSKKNAS